MPLHPQESTHRASKIATDLAVKLAIDIDMLGMFLSTEEKFHVEMQMLYVMIDLMGATNGSDPEHVIEMCRGYFQKLKRDK